MEDSTTDVGTEVRTLRIERGATVASAINPGTLPDANPRPVRKYRVTRTKDTLPESEGNDGDDSATQTRPTVRSKPAETEETRASVKAPRKGTKAAKKTAARQFVIQTLDAANMGVVQFVTPKGAMSPAERELIETPLVAYAEEHPEAFARTAEVAGPFSCLFGLGMWVWRVAKLYEAEHPGTKVIPTRFIPGRVVPIRPNQPGITIPVDSQRSGPTPDAQPEQPIPPLAPPLPVAGGVENGRSEFTNWAESITKIGG